MSTSTDSRSPGPVELSIRQKLASLLQPSSINIRNDSWQHRHHAPMRAQGGGSGESHFSIHVASEAFKGKTTLERHRMIYAALSEEFSQGLHALSLKTRTIDEVEQSSN
ncbi:hypothetical protein AX15_003653 [Amanita polypyramis BW_CC]|nr:hypothetical protein AX15_003653 [Amanita polypyramis BW_CC]